MFDDIIGLSPEKAAQWAAMAERCRPVLADEGMEAVQILLAEEGVGNVQAVAITRALLGSAATPLRVAADIVRTSIARSGKPAPAPINPTAQSDPMRRR